MEILFVTFGDGSIKWRLAAKRLSLEAKLSRKFAQVVEYNLKDLFLSQSDRSFINKYKYNKGCGFWLWKPNVILQCIKEYPDIDYIWYADAGSEINPRKDSLKSFYTLTDNLRAFEGRFFVSRFKEHEYSKTELLDHFQSKYELYVNKFENQIVGTSFIMSKTLAETLCSDWLELMRYNQYQLLKDANNPLEKHRHDQSILSLVVKNLIGKGNRIDLMTDGLLEKGPQEEDLQNRKFLVFSRNRSPIPTRLRKRLRF